jgi:peptidase YpeB-like protein
MIKIRRASAIAAGAAAVLAIGGTAALAAGADDPSPGPSSDDRVSVPMAPDGDPLATPSADDSPSPSSSSLPPANSALSISIERARSIAVRVAGGGRVVKVEGEVEHARAVWDVDVLVKDVTHDIDVDRATGTVTRHRVIGANGGVSGDDPVGHDAGDDRGGDRGGSDDGVNHDAGDDRGGDRGGSDDGVNHDDHGGNRGGGGGHGSGGHGSGD